MLVLTRFTDEEIWIDLGRIKIKVIEARSGKVRLGFEADDDVAVDRKEIALDKIRDAKARQ